MEYPTMTPHNPSRRTLLGGLLAGLFGFFTAHKAAAGPTAKPVPPSETPLASSSACVWPAGATSPTTMVYDASSMTLVMKQPLGSVVTLTYMQTDNASLMFCRQRIAYFQPVRTDNASPTLVAAGCAC